MTNDAMKYLRAQLEIESCQLAALQELLAANADDDYMIGRIMPSLDATMFAVNRYSKECLEAERQLAPYDPCAECGGEDCVCCDVYIQQQYDAGALDGQYDGDEYYQ